MNVLVVVPHSGVVIPPEISMESLSVDFPALARNIDWHTDWLYDFRDILANRQIVFPYCSLILEANRDPDVLEESVPLRDVHGRPVYRPGSEPEQELRAGMSERYLKTFHREIEEKITDGAVFLFDGHATVTARGVGDNQIDLMNFQKALMDKGPIQYCPEEYVETYASELRKRLPEVEVTVNRSEYWKVHGHVCAAHSVNSFTREGSRAPAFIQETNMRLYTGADGTPDIRAINRLRRAFAESLSLTVNMVGEK
ncbi:MAG: N-formylglutamate amidohydrolase [Syntrophales bacterium]|nr:N-formylglutamate amidohydrolase [Syntrophales bacterium]